jgi:DNA-binding NarL/FixJ family response regulator
MVDPTTPIISASTYEWAKSIETMSYKMVEGALAKHCHENTIEKNVAKVLEVIRHKKTGVSRSEITRSTRAIALTERSNIIASLLEAGEIAIRYDGPLPLYYYSGKKQ